jgi:hypothetical protein
MPTYKDYNNYSQQDKDSMRTDSSIKSNTNESTIISQTDQVESLLTDIKNLLTTIKNNNDTNTTAIVNAINGQ